MEKKVDISAVRIEPADMCSYIIYMMLHVKQCNYRFKLLALSALTR